MYKKLSSILSLIAVFLMMSVSAFGQITTSSINGRVSDESGQPMVGAVVIATHVPSGSQYHAVVNTDGRYTIEGARPGSPYVVEVSFLGYPTLKFTDVALQLGETYTQDAVMTGSETLDEVVVVASTSKFTTEKTGASTNITSSQMSNLPMVSRSISDVERYEFRGR